MVGSYEGCRFKKCAKRGYTVQSPIRARRHTKLDQRGGRFSFKSLEGLCDTMPARPPLEVSRSRAPLLCGVPDCSIKCSTRRPAPVVRRRTLCRSEEHTSELQSRFG